MNKFPSDPNIVPGTQVRYIDYKGVFIPLNKGILWKKGMEDKKVGGKIGNVERVGKDRRKYFPCRIYYLFLQMFLYRLLVGICIFH